MHGNVRVIIDRKAERIGALSEAHRDAIVRFFDRIDEFVREGTLDAAQAAVVEEHLLRLGERNFNPSNTGNLEDLFAYTLEDTGDPIRAFAQVLADSVKVVPIDEDAVLVPPLRDLRNGKSYHKVGDLQAYGAADKMLITHTMVAYGDPEMQKAAKKLVAISRPELDDAGIEREFARMAVQSQHAPSSSFVLARMSGLSIELGELYRAAGYDDATIANARGFYDVCGEFQAAWVAPFLDGRIPDDPAFASWRARYLDKRQNLPGELVYQLSSDTRTNFLDGTLESGKWVDASILFGGVKSETEVPTAIAKIVNQYIAEHIALHDRPGEELIEAWTGILAAWGIGFKNGRAEAIGGTPPKHAEIREQFATAWARKHGKK